MKFLKRLAALALPLLMLAAPVDARHFWVARVSHGAASGADSANAMSLAQFNTMSGSAAGDSAFMLGGNYTTRIQPNQTPANAGTTAAPIVYTSFSGNPADVTVGLLQETGSRADSNITISNITFAGNVQLYGTSLSRWIISGCNITAGTFNCGPLRDSKFINIKHDFSGPLDLPSVSLFDMNYGGDTTNVVRDTIQNYGITGTDVHLASGLGIIRLTGRNCVYNRFRVSLNNVDGSGTQSRFVRINGAIQNQFIDCGFYQNYQLTTAGDEQGNFALKDCARQNKFYRDTIQFTGTSVNGAMPWISLAQNESGGGIGLNTWRNCVFKNLTGASTYNGWVYDGFDADSIVGCTFVTNAGSWRSYYYRRGDNAAPAVGNAPTVVDHNIFVTTANDYAFEMMDQTGDAATGFTNNIFYAPARTGNIVNFGTAANWGSASIGPVGNDYNISWGPSTDSTHAVSWSGGNNSFASHGSGTWYLARSGVSLTMDPHSRWGRCIFTDSSAANFDPRPVSGTLAQFSPSIYAGPFALTADASVPAPTNFVAAYRYSVSPGMNVTYTASTSVGDGTTATDSVKYSTSPITTQTAFNLATLLYTRTASDSLGLAVGQFTNGLSWGTTYYVAAQTTNNIGTQSTIVTDSVSTPAYPVVGAPTDFVISNNVAVSTLARLNYSYNLTTTIGLGTTSTDSLKYSTSPITNQATFSAASQWTTVNSTAHNGSQKTGIKITGIAFATLYYVAIKTTNNLGESSSIVTDTVLTVAPYPPDTVAAFVAQYNQNVVPTIDISGSLPTQVVGGNATTSTLYIRCAATPITSNAAFDAATLLISIPDLTDDDGNAAITDYMEYPSLTVPSWGTTYYVAAQLIDNLGQRSVIASDTVAVPPDPTDYGQTNATAPLTWIINSVSSDYPDGLVWYPYLNKAGTAIDTATVRKLARFSTYGVPILATDSTGTVGSRTLMERFIQNTRALNPSIRVLLDFPTMAAYYKTYADSAANPHYYDLWYDYWKSVRGVAGWTSGMGWDKNEPHACADSTHGPQYLWNKTPGFKGLYFGARYGTMTWGGGEGATGANGYTQQNVNIAYRNAGTWPVCDSIVAVFVRQVLTRRDGQGNYMYDGAWFDNWWQRPYMGFSSTTDSVDYVRAGYASLAALDSAWVEASYVLAYKLRLACAQYSRPRFVIYGNGGSGYMYQYLNGWMREDFPNQQGGTWHTNWNYFNQYGGSQSYTYGGGLQSDAGWFTNSPRHSALNVYLHGGYADTTYLGIDTTAAACATFRYGLATAALLDGIYTNLSTSTGSFRYGGDYINWWPDESAVNTATGAATKSYQYTGWLGQPLGKWYNWCPSQSDSDYAQHTGGFETAADKSGWVPFSTGGTVAYVSDTVGTGTGALRIRQLTAYPAAYWATGIKLAQSIYSSNGDSFCVTIRTRATEPHPFRVALYGLSGAASRGIYVVWADTAWQQQRIIIPLSAGSPESISVRIWAADTTGTIFLDDVEVHKKCLGGTFIRHYAGGSVYVNPYTWADTVMVVGNKRRITSAHSPYVNNGRGYSNRTYVIIPAQSGLFLVNGGPGGPGDLGAEPVVIPSTPARLQWWRRLVRPHWR